MCDAVMGATLFSLPGLGSVSVGSALAVGGGIMSAFGAYSSGQAQQQQSNYNAQVERQQAMADEAAQRRRSSAILSQSRANIGASGVEIAGSPLEVMAQSAADAELDALTIRYGGEMRAQQAEYQGRVARASGNTSAATNLLMGLSSATRGVRASGGGGGSPYTAANGYYAGGSGAGMGV